MYEPPAPAAASGGGNPYYIRINRALNTVTVYALNDAGDYEPYTAFICSTGGATPLGTYTTFGKSRWRLLYGPCYGQYATDIVGDILFHSVPYYTQYEGDLEYNEYNKRRTSTRSSPTRRSGRSSNSMMTMKAMARWAGRDQSGLIRRVKTADGIRPILLRPIHGINEKNR